MNHHAANEILNNVRLLHFAIEDASSPFDANGYARTDFEPTISYPIVGYMENRVEAAYYEIDVSDVPEGVCKVLLKKTTKEVAPMIAVSNDRIRASGFDFEVYEGVTDICDADNEVRFYFRDVSRICNKVCPDGSECYYGVCCSKGNQCGQSCCDEGTQECCGGTCYPLCGQDANGISLVRDPDTCSCTCDALQGFTDSGDGTCQCLTENGFTWNGEACVCESGYVNVGGVCKQFGCYTSSNRTTVCTSGTSCVCFIGDEQCGMYCSPTGSTCEHGLCDATVCPGQFAYNPAKKFYGCLTNTGAFDSGVHCTQGTCCAVQNTTTCCGYGCQIDNADNCTFGSCYDECKSASPNYEYVRVGGYYGCDLGNGIQCVKHGATYDCYKGDTQCAAGCNIHGQECAYNLCEPNTCPAGTVYSEPAGDSPRCTNEEGVYCVVQQMNQSASVTGYVCYLPNGEMCGYGCQLDGSGCIYGLCESEQCGGYLYRLISSYYGCLNDATGVGCYKDSIYYTCFVNGQRCGNSCASYAGDGCLGGTCEASECEAQGLHFRKVATNWFGCYDASTGLGCYKSGPVYVCYKDGVQCGTRCRDYKGTGCDNCVSEIKCAAGGEEITHGGYPACRYESGLICRTDGTCYINSYRCGTNCNKTVLDGTNCTTGVCLETECPHASMSWEYAASSQTYECFDIGYLSCENGTCLLDGSQCGIGCQNGSTGAICNGSDCTQSDEVICQVGVCDAKQCGSLSLNKATKDFFGCYNSDSGTICYPDGTGITYTCFAGGNQIGTHCQMDGTGCTCNGGFYMKDGQCTICRAGTYTTALTASGEACTPCPAGQYQPSDGAQSCNGCAAGTYSTEGANTCLTCGVGAVSTTNASACTCDEANGYTGTWKANPSDVNDNGCSGGRICTNNSNCEADEFCAFENTTDCYSSGIGTCRKISDFGSKTITLSVDGSTQNWVRSTSKLKWWSAQNWCRAQGLTPARRSMIGCGNVLANGVLNSCDSTIMKEFKKYENDTYVWLEDFGSGCTAYIIGLHDGYVLNYYRNSDFRSALCR